LIYFILLIGTPIENLNLEIGSNQVPRIYCANHKLNLVVTHSIQQQKVLDCHITKLNAFISKIRKSVELSRDFQELKCRLRYSKFFRFKIKIKN